mmetsp:Transcript_9770/g.23325  ORF Transcript_9770/g.23325 Transcript_9770/m.23325 type:complete len:124 (+) Transcript_9770:262-633(+)
MPSATLGSWPARLRANACDTVSWHVILVVGFLAARLYKKNNEQALWESITSDARVEHIQEGTEAECFGKASTRWAISRVRLGAVSMLVVAFKGTEAIKDYVADAITLGPTSTQLPSVVSGGFC